MGIIAMISIAIAIAFLFDKKINETIAFSLITILLLIYCLGRVSLLSASVYVICGIGCISLIYSVYDIFIKKAKCNNVLNFGFLAFILFAVFFVTYSYGRDMKTTDEFRTWGAMVKNFYYFDKFYDIDMHFAGVGDYPPGSAMWLYFLNKTWITYSDSICILGNAIFVISLFLPVISKINKNNKIFYFTICLPILLFLPITRNLHAYLTITPDALMTGFICFFIYCMLEYLKTNDKWYFVSDVLCLAALCVTKNSGIVFASLLIIVYCYITKEIQVSRISEYFVLSIVTIISYASWYGFKLYCLVPIVCILVAMIVFLLKKLAIKYITTNIAISIIIAVAIIGRFLGSIDIEAITYNSFASKVVTEHVYAFFAFDLFEANSDGYIPVPYGDVVLGMLLIYILFEKLIGKENKLHRESFFVIAIVMLFYDLIMLIMQLFVIGPGMNYMAHTPDRYMTPMIIVSLYLILYVFLSSDRIKSKAFGIIFLMIVICLVDIKSFALEIMDKYQCIGYYALEDYGITPGIGDEIFYIDEDYNYEYRDLEFAYYFTPASTNDVETPIGRLQYSVEELEEVLASGYDYVYLQTCNDDFTDRYRELFDNPQNISAGRAYYIDNNGGNICLIDLE